jgi:fatty-acid desaturase
MYLLVCAAVFVAAYLVNLVMITVFYHRGIAHKAVTLSPRALRFAAVMGNWLTGLDPKGWVCMHRLHHAHSDTDLDPHSPRRWGFFGVMLGQLKSYKKILVGLAKKQEPYTSMVADLDFGISWLNRKRVWYLPYVVHFAIAAALGACGFALLGAAYFLGMMSHPIEGFLVNSFGHAVGGRNFDTPDDSRNNHVVAWLIFGEGYQNNHHRYPSSAKFSYRWWEIDPGYGLCLALELFGVVKIARNKLIPKPSEVAEVSETAALIR